MMTVSVACLVFVNVQITVSPASMSRGVACARSPVLRRGASLVAGAHQAGQRPAGTAGSVTVLAPSWPGVEGDLAVGRVALPTSVSGQVGRDTRAGASKSKSWGSWPGRSP